MTRSADSAWLEATVRTALAHAMALAFPVECAGCDQGDVELCEACRAALAPCAERRPLQSGLRVWSGLRFEGVPARVIRALKEEGRTSLAGPLAEALGVAADATTGGSREGGRTERIVFVPVPTSRSAFRRRGFRVVDLIARRAGLPTAPLLTLGRGTADQRLLGRTERRRNVAGSLQARDAAGRRVVILDDVVTSGATLDEAARALRAAGADVVGAATVAATPLHGKRRVTASETRT